MASKLNYHGYRRDPRSRTARTTKSPNTAVALNSPVALAVLAEYQPQVVLGMGGFASGPRCGCGHDSKAFLWLSTSRTLLLAPPIALSARIARPRNAGLPRRALSDGEWCGNPVRPAIANLCTCARSAFRRDALATTKSLGTGRQSRCALAINNRLLPEALAQIDPRRYALEVMHQTGKWHTCQATTRALYTKPRTQCKERHK